jgi:hypothetical protein
MWLNGDILDLGSRPIEIHCKNSVKRHLSIRKLKSCPSEFVSGVLYVPTMASEVTT